MFSNLKQFFKRLYNKLFSRSRYYPEGIWDEHEKQPKPQKKWWQFW